mmetsp:Transcript_3008/g.6672  ORF Transcript_3008/g.6672 Transcript_3008/m.6672 type:complete len:246 (+) Transcript_3008:164-901(+)
MLTFETAAACLFIFSSFSSSSFGSISVAPPRAADSAPPSSASYQSRSSWSSSGSSGSLTSIASSLCDSSRLPFRRLPLLRPSASSSECSSSFGAALISFLLPLNITGLPPTSFFTSWAFSLSRSSVAAFSRNSRPAFHMSSLVRRCPTALASPFWPPASLLCAPWNLSVPFKPTAASSLSGSHEREASRSLSFSARFSSAFLSRPNCEVLDLKTSFGPSFFSSPPTFKASVSIPRGSVFLVTNEN